MSKSRNLVYLVYTHKRQYTPLARADCCPSSDRDTLGNSCVQILKQSRVQDIAWYKRMHRLVSVRVFNKLGGGYIAYGITRKCSAQNPTCKRHLFKHRQCYAMFPCGFFICHLMSVNVTFSVIKSKTYLFKIPTGQFNKYHLLFLNYNSMFIRV